MDQNQAHAQPGGQFHYHGIPDGLIDTATNTGLYTQDWVYQTGSGELDARNGTTINSEYVYLMTENSPYLPRCVYGRVDASFNKRG